MHRHLPGKAQCPGHGEANSQASETARAAIHQNFVSTALVWQLGDHRRELFGMSAADHLMPFCDNSLTIDQRG